MLDGIKGIPEPRLFTPELRKLTRRTTKGFEVIDFARLVLGEPLMPWQERAVIRGLELLPDKTYRFRILITLVARQNGKSHLSKVIKLWKAYVDNAKLILGVGQDLTLTREQWQLCLDTIKMTPDLAQELDYVRLANGEQEFRLTNGGRYKISAATRSAGRGLSVDHLDFEEIREQTDWLAWAALSKTTSARPRSQINAISNAGDDASLVLNQLREAALSGADPSIGLLEWSGPDGCDLDDPVAIAHANPSLGYSVGVSPAALRSALISDPPGVYRTEVLCQRVETLDGAVDLSAWRDCRDVQGSLASIRDRIFAVADVSPDSLHVTLAAAGVDTIGRVRVQVINSWHSTDHARAEIPEMMRLLGPDVPIGWWPKGPAAVLSSTIKSLEDGTRVAIPLTAADAAEACMTLADLVAARRVIHPGDPLLDAHVAGCKKYPQGDAWRFVRRGAGHVDAAYAAAGAVFLALNPPELPKSKPTMMVV